MTLCLGRVWSAILITLALGPACNAGAEAPPATSAAASTVDSACATLRLKLGQALEAAVSARGVTGAAAAVDVPGCSFRGASGVGAESLFRIGSITKTFVATLVLMLRAEGRLSLDDLVSAHLTGVPGGDTMTLRSLLNHTSGLFNYTDSGGFQRAAGQDPSRVFTPQELIGFAAGQAPYFAPGTGFHYSNTNYIVAGLILEKVGDEPLERQLHRRILGPAGLSRTYLDGSEPALPGLVSGYLRHGHRLDDVTYAGSPSGAWAAGALVSTTDDVNRFLARLLAGGLLQPAELQEMTTWTRTNFPQAPGYGLGISEHNTPVGVSYGHVGSYLGYDAWAAGVATRGATITVLSNLYEAGAMDIADSLAAALR